MDTKNIQKSMETYEKATELGKKAQEMLEDKLHLEVSNIGFGYNAKYRWISYETYYMQTRLQHKILWKKNKDSDNQKKYEPIWFILSEAYAQIEQAQRYSRRKGGLMFHNYWKYL